MDKKIGIATWYTNGNYGGTLQAYALQKILEFMGYDSEFINLCVETKSISYKVKRLLKDVAIFIYKPRFYLSRLRIFKFVRDNLKVSSPYYTYNQLIDATEKKYSAAICGSDQIWSNVGGRIEPLNYLTFIEKKKRIAYAPSTGYNRISDDIKDTFKEYINDIEFLSVREKQGAAFIKEVTGSDAEVVLDPSLLLTREQWEKEINKTHKEYQEENYIFCYLLGNNHEHVKYAKLLSEHTGYPIVAVESKFLSLKGIKKAIADPFDFLNYIRNASYVLTDSFHGVTFSIILGKQFGVFKRFHDDDPINQNARIYNILESTGLEDRLISEKKPISLLIEEKIDYVKVHEILDIERRRSLRYLEDAISTVVNSQII